MQQYLGVLTCFSLLLFSQINLSEAVSLRRRKHMFGEDPTAVTLPTTTINDQSSAGRLHFIQHKPIKVYTRRKLNKQEKNKEILSQSDSAVVDTISPRKVSAAAMYFRKMHEARKKGDPKAIEFFNRKNAKRRIYDQAIRDRVKNKTSTPADEERVKRQREKQDRYRLKKLGKDAPPIKRRPKPDLSSLTEDEIYKRRREKQNVAWRKWYQRQQEGRAKGDEKSIQNLKVINDRRNNENKSRRKRIKDGSATIKDIKAEQRMISSRKKYNDANPEKIKAWKKKSYLKIKAMKEARSQEEEQ